MVGVVVVSYRPNVSAGGTFASIEDLWVTPDHRSQGVGRGLLDLVERRCAKKNISYVEVHIEEDEAEAFYTEFGYEREEGVRVLSRSYILQKEFADDHAGS